jgi:hypothetical protein
LSDALIPEHMAYWKSIMFILQNIGGAIGIYAYAKVTQHTGRKPAVQSPCQDPHRTQRNHGQEH